MKEIISAVPMKPQFSGSDDASVRATFGMNLKIARQLLGLTQTELAAKIGVQRPVIGLVEKGEQNVTINLMCKLANGVERPPYELMNPNLFNLGNEPHAQRR